MKTLFKYLVLPITLSLIPAFAYTNVSAETKPTIIASNGVRIHYGHPGRWHGGRWHHGGRWYDGRRYYGPRWHHGGRWHRGGCYWRHGVRVCPGASCFWRHGVRYCRIY